MFGEVEKRKIFRSFNNKMYFLKIPETVCSTVDIPVPSQTTLHKQWCLFDQEKNIDFDRQVWEADTKSISTSVNLTNVIKSTRGF